MEDQHTPWWKRILIGWAALWLLTVLAHVASIQWLGDHHQATLWTETAVGWVLGVEGPLSVLNPLWGAASGIAISVILFSLLWLIAYPLFSLLLR